jgi:asparagine synthase (glutamine-hydrolysing)
MSVIFGRWNVDGAPLESGYVEKVRPTLARYSPDVSSTYSDSFVSILYHAFHTTRESHLETQSLLTRSGAVLTWDGRLDNRGELIGQLKELRSHDCDDMSIVAAAYEQWGNHCFGKLVGDWALSIWNPKDRSIILIKDPIGLRHLYYTVAKNQVTWSTILEPLVLFAGKAFTVNEEYLAGWFSSFPAAQLTPYADIHSVPPSSCVRIDERGQTVQQYWTFDPEKRISYNSDEEYEAHFRDVFAKSVQRRLRSDSPILAELSGGMDSSSIVCMADNLISRGTPDCPRIDTVSYYDDSEPHWNERPYFTKVEEMRGRIGCHINAHHGTSFLAEYDRTRFPATPGTGSKPNTLHVKFTDYLRSEERRVVLSGLGGDEVLGGVPTPIPELADYLVRGHFRKCGKQIVRWAITKRNPVLYLAASTLRAFLPVGAIPLPRDKRPPVWLFPDFIRRNRSALSGYETRLKLFGPLPTFQGNQTTLDGLRRQLACFVMPSDPPYERRYPYLDRDLLEFIYAIPREQLLRPGQRRSLMRRALVGIVPNEILDRKRKAFIDRSPRVAISAEWDRLVQMTQQMISCSLGVIDSKLFREALENARHNSEAQVIPLMRAAALESWLTSLACWNPQCVLRSTASGQNAGRRPDGFPTQLWRNVLSTESKANAERR